MNLDNKMLNMDKKKTIKKKKKKIIFFYKKVVFIEIKKNKK